MKISNKIVFIVTGILSHIDLFAQAKGNYDAIHSGVPWFDDKGKVLSAHGACIIKDNNKFYLFGERHSDTSNAFEGFNCYSSSDLHNWKFESIALPQQPEGKLGPNRVGERVKVMKCPSTGEYIMYMHVDTLGYRDQFIGYATSKKITGPYLFKGPLLFKGDTIRKWDMGTFQDKDGSGYVLLHGGDIYKLSNDYKTASELVLTAMSPECESPAVFRKDSIYYWLSSHRTSWERNDNFYFTATSLRGPWTSQGLFAPEGSLTWNSQTTFVLPIEGTHNTTYMFMGDRWSFPKQASAATYVWQPLTVSGTSLSIPEYFESWQINTSTGRASIPVNMATIISNVDQFVSYEGGWNYGEGGAQVGSYSDEKDASLTFKFNGKQVGLHSWCGTDGGYANVAIRNSKGKVILSSVVDMYCKNSTASMRFISPILPKGNYIFTVSVLREKGNWSDKRKKDYGSTGFYVSIDHLTVK